MNPTNSLTIARQLTLILIVITIISTSFSIVNAGERGVLMKFGEVQEVVLDEGLHPIIPIVNTVKKLSVRVQKQEILAEASSKDLQKVSTDVALNWHIIPEEANVVFQEIGDENEIVERIIDPAIKEVVRAVIAKYSAEEIVDKRNEVKVAIANILIAQLASYHIAVDRTALVETQFSQEFSDAVEAKQVAQQQAKQAGYLAQRAAQEAQAKVNLAKGEAESEVYIARGKAEAHKLLQETLTQEILKNQVIEKWDGKLPFVVGKDTKEFLEFDLPKIVKANQK